MGMIEAFLFVTSALLILSVCASKTSGKLGVPALVMFLFIGMLAGSEGPGGIYFDNPSVAQTMGVLALIFILFSGGLDTEWHSIRPVIRSGLRLSVAGVLLTCVFTALFAQYVLGFDPKLSFLLGAIVSSTDAAAVFATLRARQIGLPSRLSALLELESGSNDPMAVFLTIGALQLIQSPDTSVFILIPLFLQQMALGGIFGFLAGRATVELLNRIKLEYEGLYPVLTIAATLLVYAGTQSVGGNGFLAVYIMGITLGDGNFVHRRSLMMFHDGIAWLMQIAMFLVLGLLVFPSELLGVVKYGLMLSFFLMFVARPLSIGLALAGERFSVKEKLLLSWVGLRGAVPIILATYPLIEKVPQAEMIFNLVFFVVLTSVILQGSTIPLVSQKLGVASDGPTLSKLPIEYIPNKNSDLTKNLTPLSVLPTSLIVGKTLLEVGFPEETLVVLIQRDGAILVPRGSTQIEAGDTLLLFAEHQKMKEIRTILG